MNRTDLLRKEIELVPKGRRLHKYYQYLGYKKDFAASNLQARVNATEALFTLTPAHIYDNDLIVGCIRPLWCEKSEEETEFVTGVADSFGERLFIHNRDHYTPDYRRIVKGGIPGLLEEIACSERVHADDAERMEFLDAMKQTVMSLRAMLLKYADAAKAKAEASESDEARADMLFVESNCRAVADNAPATFAQGLQLMWMFHIGLWYEQRGALALGRIDQYLYELFENDMKNGTLTHERAVELLGNTFIKIYECGCYGGDDDTVNICIGGTSPDGSCDVNELSYCVLEAVRDCNVPGPNLSARIAENCPDEFLDACLKVIGTGLGYPALMNDRVNIEALKKIGYAQEDVYDYSMVGCIENFISGKQPPWSDGRFDTPRFLEYIFNNGKGIVHPSIGLDTGDVETIDSMDEFMRRYEAQLAFGADDYYFRFRNENERLNPKNYRQPLLSTTCRDCIGRGLDINEGGSIYPSAHGVCLMGIGTVADSLAAIEKVVFADKQATMAELAAAIKANFEGYEDLRKKLMAAPKYGNNDDFVDKYAVWFVEFQAKLFEKYKTRDGGAYYIAIAANIQNISAGEIISATPDGRLAGEPMSDAASPTYGRDTRGATSTVNSISKPDYSQVACGTVVNQKFSPSMFEDGNRSRLITLIKTYFKKGGQEMQINATSREVLIDAMNNPENYGNLVVRVSGFSAFYVTLDKAVQLDILNRTQQG